MSVEINADSKGLTRGHHKFTENDEKFIVKDKIIAEFDFLRLAKSRRSIRRFTEKDVTKEQLLRLIDAAQSAPSAGNCQPWHFYVIKNKNLQEQMKDSAYQQGFILYAPACIVVCTESKRSGGRYGERGRELYCLQDTAAAVQNILLCAKSMGLGTCWVGAFDEAKVTEILNLPEGLRPVAIIPVGEPAEDFKPQNRRTVDEIVTFIEE